MSRAEELARFVCYRSGSLNSVQAQHVCAEFLELLEARGGMSTPMGGDGALEEFDPPDSPPIECWHVIDSSRLTELLRRAYEGENPDLLYIEEYVNAEREDVS